MGRRSYTPSPPPRGGYGRRRSPSPRGGRYGGGGGYGGGRGRDLPTSLLVRNLRHDCLPDDLRRPFGQFGPLKDVYLPRDYYSGEPRGFGFVQFVEPADAEEAKYQMDGQILLGRQMTVVFAEENRKKPSDMRVRERRSGSRFSSDRRRSPPPRYSRSPRYARSPPRRYSRSRSPRRDYSPAPRRRHYSRSVSPVEKRYSRERSYSGSPVRGHSPSHDDAPRSPSRSPVNGSRSRSRSPVRDVSRSRSPSRSRSRSADPRDYDRDVPPHRDASASP
uniref:Serine/arginine-rich SC35-like splicing factor SCL30A n=1 Tax=Tanacetum cinerariifolium TaxID=118510 RepID=A0A6L2JNB4_TANCI|nr:serine/arginine-rich SC35-like splicing factor SCL30A [Tanacetum cinerariifolium]